MTRVYVDRDLVSGEELELPADAAHHVRTVLRLPADSEITLFNGRGGTHAATLATLRRDAVSVIVGNALTCETESPLEITLVQSVSRGERMDFTLQKAVELGVRRIVPVTSARTVVKLDDKRQSKRLAHWRGIVQHAAEQSGRTIVPELESVVPLAEWRARGPLDSCYVLHPTAAAPLARQPRPTLELTVVAGPEGGFDEREIAMLETAGATAVGLGPRILRTETAAICALAVLQAQWGDLA